MPTIEGLIDSLFVRYGPQGWWPLLERDQESGEWRCLYRPGDDLPPPLPQSRFEIGVGAILTQNTAWKGVTRALVQLKQAGRLYPQGLAEEKAADEIRRLIRPSGYFNQKQRRLKRWADFFLTLSGRTPERAELLSLKGVGPETADSILLYAYGYPCFIADAYARRIIGRYFGGQWSYEALAARVNLEFEGRGEEERRRKLGEAHALLVEHGKRFCRRKADCPSCFLNRECKGAMEAEDNGRP